MNEPTVQVQRATDGYNLHIATWTPAEPRRGSVVVLHGVQSHGGWYHGLGRTLSGAGYEAIFPDRRGSGANMVDRGHTPSAGRLLADVEERLEAQRQAHPGELLALAGLSWGGKIAVVVAGRRPDLVDRLALICPGLRPRVDVSLRERLAIAAAWLTGRGRRRTFPVPLNDPALFTSHAEGRAFIAADPLALRRATASTLVASRLLDGMVGRMPPRIQQPVLLMLAGQDRIVDNARTLAYFDRLAAADRTVIDYPEGHHTLEFEPDPTRYARDLAAWLDAGVPGSRGSAAGSGADLPLLPR